VEGNHHLKLMRKQILVFSTFVIFCLIAIAVGKAGTIPAGTVLVVETLDSIYTKDMVGKTFNAQLADNIVIQGSVVARAGTKFVGKVESSTKMGPLPLTVNLTAASIHGKTIPVKTTGAYKPQSAARGGRRQVTTRDFVLPPGSKLPFHLAEPLSL
jgi:hypothetical protein